MNKFIRPYHLTEKYGKNFPFYSFSKCSTIERCPYEYKLSLKHRRGTNIYAEIGNIVHSALEDCIQNNLSNEDVIKSIQLSLTNLFKQYYFFKDKKKDEKTKKNYLDNIIHFFKRHKPEDIKECYTEKPIWLNLGDEKCCVFLGFIDLLMVTKDKEYIIIDYKTGAIEPYTGKDKAKQETQMHIYALGLIDSGVDINSIKAYWNFIQYANVTFSYNGEAIKTRVVKRNEIFEAFSDEIMDNYSDIDDAPFGSILSVNLNEFVEKLHPEIQDSFTIEECLIPVDINENILNNTTVWLKEKVAEIERRMYEDDWEHTPRSDQKFYCENLCSFSKHCKHMNEYSEIECYD